MFDWIVSLMQQGGYLGVFLLMLAENIFPPIPSELVMPLAGFLAANGEMSLWVAILVGTAGSVLGAFLWYYLGLAIGEERLCWLAARYGRILTVSPEEIRTASAWFRNQGRIVVLLGRMVPAVRTLISVPAGVARMPFIPFLVLTTIGSLIWTSLLTIAGYVLQSQYSRVEGWINPATTVVVGIFVLWYLFRLVRFNRA